MPIGSLDRWPEDYERGRPGWPREAVDVAALPPTATVLELGAGTGKLTRLLVAAFDRVVALEPAEPMRRLLATQCPEAETVTGTAEDIPLADASVDAVFAAEAFHRFDEGARARRDRPRPPAGRGARPPVEPPGRADGPADRRSRAVPGRATGRARVTSTTTRSTSEVRGSPSVTRSLRSPGRRSSRCRSRSWRIRRHRPGRPACVLRLDGLARRPSRR